MFKIYDTNKHFLMLLDSCQDIHTIEQLATGTRNLEFYAPVNDINLANLVEENYLETADYSYIIKEVIMDDNSFFKVFCIANYEELAGINFEVFDLYRLNLQQGYEYCISQAPEWSIDYQSENRTMITYQEANKSGFEMIKTIAADNDQEFWFDTKNKKVIIYDQGKMGKEIGTYYTNELKLQQLSKQSSSYEYCTVLYPYGKDGLNISSVNGGKKYLTNNTYTNKYIEKVWVDEKYEYAEDLKKAAELYLEELSQPKCSYKLKLSSIKDEVQLGDTIFLVDKLKRIKQKQRVVKIVRYPKQPEKSVIEISNLRLDFTTTYLKNQEKIKQDIDYIKKQMDLLRQ